MLNTDEVGGKGYFLVVYLEVPEELHDKFNNYRLAPHQYSPKYRELSEYNKYMIKKGLGLIPSQEKNSCTLYNKENLCY
jgi:hypothetical protein